MVNFSTIAIIGGLGLLIFFKKDVGSFLNQFKGFGAEFGKDFGKLPDITINVPDFGIPEAFAETGKVAEATGAGIVGAISETGKAIEQAGVGAREVIFQAGVEAREGFDKSIADTQAGFEQFGKDVETNIGIIGEGLTSIFGGIFPTKEITTVSETAPSIVTTSRRSGTTTRFGGQTAPKEILTKETATTEKLIVSEQPDLSLVSPFLKTGTGFPDDPRLSADPEKVPENFFQGIILSRRSGTTGGR